jgi:CheY-like chemotaxis protein
MISLENKNILVVEDDDMNFIYLRQVFKIIKGNLVRVKNGLSAIEACKNQTFDIILLDLKLPDISGYDVLRAIRVNNQTVPIIVQTASMAPEDHYEALKAGCNYVLVKPFKIDELSDILSKVLVG